MVSPSGWAVARMQHIPPHFSSTPRSTPAFWPREKPGARWCQRGTSKKFRGLAGAAKRSFALGGDECSTTGASAWREKRNFAPPQARSRAPAGRRTCPRARRGGHSPAHRRPLCAAICTEGAAGPRLLAWRPARHPRLPDKPTCRSAPKTPPATQKAPELESSTGLVQKSLAATYFPT